jgi:hypothetical protein
MLGLGHPMHHRCHCRLRPLCTLECLRGSYPHPLTSRLTSRCSPRTLMPPCEVARAADASSTDGAHALPVCWGCRMMAARRSPMKLYLTHLTFTYTVTINTFVARFVGRSSFAQWRSSSPIRALTGTCPGGGPRSDQEVVPEVTSRRRFPRKSCFGGGHMSSHDWLGTKIFCKC